MSDRHEDAHSHRFGSAHLARLLGPEREARWRPREFLHQAGVRPGQVAIDVGCGPGFWTLPLAGIVGESGSVTAIDASAEMLAALEERRPPANVRTLLAEFPAIPMPDAAADFAWVAFAMHEVERTGELAAELRRALRAGGVAAVLEWRPDGRPGEGPPAAPRVSVTQVTEWLRGAGFAEVELVWQDESAYLVRAR